MERAVFVYTTYPSIVEAEKAGRALVERRLCACVNIYPGMISYYWWQGAVERGEEVTMIVKTRASLSEKVRAAVRQMHSYTTPAILVIPLESVDPDYHAWIEAETAAADGCRLEGGGEGRACCRLPANGRSRARDEESLVKRRYA